MNKKCRHCRGTGVDRKFHYRFTSDGHDDQSCVKCDGTGERPDKNENTDLNKACDSDYGLKHHRVE